MGDTSNNFHFFVLHNCNILSPLMPTHETTDKPIKLHLNRQLERENVRFKSRRKYLKKKQAYCRGVILAREITRQLIS